MMIDPKDLRLGNLFLNSTCEVDTVRGIYDGYVNPVISMHTLEIDGDTWEAILPIPITSKWLGRFGLNGIEQNDGSFNFFQDRQKKGVAFWVEQNEPGVFTVYYGGFVRGVKVESVHQLQNLHSALTGEELEIKLP